MRDTTRSKTLKTSEIAAYVCVASTMAFVLALTFGLLNDPERPRDIAANESAGVSSSTP